MKFDARGVHLWTRQRGGEGYGTSCQSHAGGLGCDVVFLAISCRDIFPWSKASELFRGVDVPSNVEWHHHSNGSISWVTL